MKRRTESVKYFFVRWRTGEFGYVSEKVALDMAKHPSRYSVKRITTIEERLT